MNASCYRLRLSGLDAPPGAIGAQHLHDVVGALLQTSERAVRVAALGESVGPGPKPAWLRAALALTVDGITEGSTILELAAPPLGEAASALFDQGDFWIEAPKADDTALSVAAAAIDEALSPGGAGERYDAGVIAAVLKFRKALPSTATVELIEVDGARGAFRLDATVFERLRETKRSLPPPRAFIVSGVLDRIEHSRRRFQLVLPNGQKLLGRSQSEFLDVEQMRNLWGKPATVEGIVHFMPNGAPRLIEARKLKRQESGEEIFERLPTKQRVGTEPEFFAAFRAAGPGDPMTLWGTWPGDEPIEELMAALR